MDIDCPIYQIANCELCSYEECPHAPDHVPPPQGEGNVVSLQAQRDSHKPFNYDNVTITGWMEGAGWCEGCIHKENRPVPLRNIDLRAEVQAGIIWGLVIIASWGALFAIVFLFFKLWKWA